jgi:hypothetical protein
MDEELEIGALIDNLQAVREEKSRLAKEEKKLTAKEEVLSNAIIERLHDLKLERATHHGITVRPDRKTYPHLEDWGSFCDFLNETKNYHLLIKQVSVTSYREMLELGRAVPGVVPFVKTKLSVTTS